jgi:hypothetical protein
MCVENFKRNLLLLFFTIFISFLLFFLHIVLDGVICIMKTLVALHFSIFDYVNCVECNRISLYSLSYGKPICHYCYPLSHLFFYVSSQAGWNFILMMKAKWISKYFTHTEKNSQRKFYFCRKIILFSTTNETFLVVSIASN